MAVNTIAFPVAARQNTNDDSTAFGKWFMVPYWPETLTLRGLIERVAFDQSVYSRDIVVDQIQGVRINFIPENGKGEELTSKKLKDLCTFEVLGYLVSTNIGTQQKPKYQRVLYPLGYQAPTPGNNG